MGKSAEQLQRSRHQQIDDSMASVTAETTIQARLLGEFLNDYCTPSFGGLSKREIDLLVFRLLIRAKQFNLESSQQSISRFLRIPIGKVKSLIYETRLRDNYFNENWFRSEVLKILQVARLHVTKSGAYVKLVIEDPMLRRELESMVKKLNGLADYSFNSDILKLDFETYALLIKEIVIDHSEQSKLEQALRSAIDVKGKEKLNWRELVSEFLKGAANEIGSQSVDLTFGYLSGGANMFASSAKKLLKQNI